MTYSEIRDIAFADIRVAKNTYKDNLQMLLRTNHLDGIVERVRDGRKGKLCVMLDVTETLGYDLKFYPITKKGTVSLKADGYIGWTEDITQTYKEATL